MTVPVTSRTIAPYAGNGVATAFPFSIRFFAASDIALIKTDSGGTDTTLTLNDHYTVTLNADQLANPGGTITYPRSGSGYSVLASNETLTLQSAVPESQPTDLPNGGAFNAENVETAIDRLAILIKDHASKLARSIMLPASDGQTGLLPNKAARAGKVLGFDELGAPSLLTGDDIAFAPVILPDITPEVFTATAGQTAFTLTDHTYAPGTGQLEVHLNGALLTPETDYTETSSTVFTLASGAAASDTVHARIAPPATAGIASATSVSYVGGAAGSISQSVQSKLRERVSAWDVGIAPDGSNQQSAIESFLAWCRTNNKEAFFPAGNYNVNTGVSMASPIWRDLLISGEGKENTNFVVDPAGTAFTDNSGSTHFKAITVVAASGRDNGIGIKGYMGLSSIRECSFIGLSRSIQHDDGYNFIVEGCSCTLGGTFYYGRIGDRLDAGLSSGFMVNVTLRNNQAQETSLLVDAQCVVNLTIEQNTDEVKPGSPPYHLFLRNCRNVTVLNNWCEQRAPYATAVSLMDHDALTDGTWINNGTSGSMTAPNFAIGNWKVITAINVQSPRIDTPDLRVGTHSAIGSEILTGYITVRDYAGNTRKIAVVS